MTPTRTYRALAALLAASTTAAAGACTRYVYRPPDCPPKPALPAVERAVVPREAGTLVGDLRSTLDGRPVGWADVALEGTTRQTTTDSAGTFRFDTLPAGRYVLRTRRIGYAPRRVDSLTVGGADGVRLTVPLAPQVLDGCPGFIVVRERVPWWKLWRR
jgi:hypothetical protein